MSPDVSCEDTDSTLLLDVIDVIEWDGAIKLFARLRCHRLSRSSCTVRFLVLAQILDSPF